jgi:N-acyl-D-aspartate/D-glutamate deacylase
MGELADFFGIDAGHIRKGDRADVEIVNPEGLNDDLDNVRPAPLENLPMTRVVKCNDLAALISTRY